MLPLTVRSDLVHFVPVDMLSFEDDDGGGVFPVEIVFVGALSLKIGPLRDGLTGGGSCASGEGSEGIAEKGGLVVVVLEAFQLRFRNSTFSVHFPLPIIPAAILAHFASFAREKELRSEFRNLRQFFPLSLSPSPTAFLRAQHLAPTPSQHSRTNDERRW